MASDASQLVSRRTAAWWTLAIGLALTAALGWELHREAVNLDRQRLARRVVEIQSQLDARLEKSEMLLHNLRDYLTWNSARDEKDFQRWCYANGHTINCRWLAGIALATNRSLVKWPEDVPKTPRTWGVREIELLTVAANAQPIECDLEMTSQLTNALRFLADYDLRGGYDDTKRFVHTIQSPRLAMSGQQIVMQDPLGNGIVGACFYVPLFRPAVNALVAELMQGTFTNWSQRALPYWFHFDSMIVAPVDFQFLAWSLSEGGPEDVAIEIFSSTKQTAQTWLNGSTGIPRAADPAFKAYMTNTLRWPMYGLRFSIFFYTTPIFEAQSPRRLAWITAGAGAILTLLAAALVGVAMRARDRQDELTEQIREGRDALAAAQEERGKISRDLHDGTIQSLYAVQLGLDRTVEKLAAEPSRAGNELSAVRRELDAVIAEIRQFITAEAGPGEHVDFSTVLQALAQRARTGTTAHVALHCDPAAARQLDGDQSVHLANIAREALSNSLRHGKPQRIEVALRQEKNFVSLTIRDDGAGFDPALPRQTGLGLTSMASRAREMGAMFAIASSPGSGACITVQLPIAVLEPAESDE